MGDDVDRLTEAELIRNCITPNIPFSWKKDFKLGEGHLLLDATKAARRLKIIEDCNTSNSKNQHGKDNPNGEVSSKHKKKKKEMK